MSNWQGEIRGGDGAVAMPELLFPNISASNHTKYLRKVRKATFAKLFAAARLLNIAEPGCALYYSRTLDLSTRQQIVAGTTEGLYGEPVLRVYSNIDGPSDDASRPGARNLRMTAFAASAIGKRIECVTSNAITEDIRLRWRTDGGFAGPRIWRDDTLGIIDIRGNPDYVAPILPHPSTLSSIQETANRTKNVLTMLGILAEINPLHIEENLHVFIPPVNVMEL